MPRLRYQTPDRLPGATAFSKHDELRGALNTVRLLKSQRWAWDELRATCAGLESDYARRREPGHWELAAVAFVASGHVDIQRWLDETTDELWHECGFAGKPPYMRVWRRLRELETVCEAFLGAAGKVIRRCREHDERVMAHVHIDCTEDETHAALIHDCQEGEDCAFRAATTRTGRRRAAPGRARRPERVKTGVARAQRQAWNSEPPKEAAQDEQAASPERTETVVRGGKPIKRIKQGGCWYRTRDLDAGIRAYEGQRGARRFWHGYYAGKAICHFTGGVVPSVDSASTQEYDLFPRLYDRVRKMADKPPETVIGDKGFSISRCFEHATRNGTAPVFPFRAAGGDRRRHDKETHDRHGVMRCKHCGGPMEQVRFSANGGKPRLWFTCMLGFTPGCAKEQTISCSTDWRSLIPLSRLHPIYHELKESHQSYEGVHDYWRDRYKVAADDLGVRPKVVSIDWHRLRANVACLIEWLRIGRKNGWLGSARRARRKGARRAEGERRFKEAGERIAADLAGRRLATGLGQPYGPKAAALGLGEATPPSRRPRGAPPGKQ
jgi:hypothetical protein